MRAWDRYFVVTGDKSLDSKQNVLDVYGDAQMQACKRTAYSTREEFFKGYAPYFPRRYKYYHQYLKENIKKDEQGLSIGSGQCINELPLLSEGYHIQCSDKEDLFNGVVRRLFPEFKFTKFDVTASPFPHKMDYVISLSLIFCFDHDQLLKVFQNIAASLKTGGLLIVDPSGAQDNVFTYCIDNYLCRLDAQFQFFIKRYLLGRDVRVIKESFGYRWQDKEIVDVAKEAGFVLENLQRFDYETELKDRLLLFNRLPDPVVSCFGRTIPYVRFFKFRKV